MNYKLTIRVLVALTVVLGPMASAVVPKIPLSRAAQEIEERLKATVESAIMRLLPTLVRSSSDVDLSFECQAAIFQVLSGLKDLKPWAVHMLDAMGKPPSGIMEGAAMALGSYDQCLEIVNPRQNSSVPVFVGQYCSVELLPFEPGTVDEDKYLDVTPNFTGKTSSGLFADPTTLLKTSLRVGLCIPSTCSREDLQEITAQVSKQLSMYLRVLRCETKQPFELETEELTSLGIFAAVIAFIVLCTVIDLCTRKTSLVNKFIQNISFVSNTERFLSYRNVEPDMSALAGMRFLGILWNILGNSYFLGYVLNFTQFSRRTGILEFESQFTYGPISNFFVSYEVPFFITGLVGTYASLKRVRTSSKIRSVFKNLFDVLIRMTLLTMLTTLISLAFSHTKNGPLWGDVILPVYEKCKIYWWRNLIHIGNFFSADDSCLIHNWILACHVHIEIVCLAVVLPLLFMRRLGVCMNVIYILASMVATAVITAVYNLPPALDGVGRDYRDNSGRNFVEYISIRPYTHLAVYCIGIFFAIIIAEYKDIKINKFVMSLGWILAAGCSIGSVYALLDFRKGYDVGVVAGAIYAGLHRSVFALSLGWVAFVCARSQKSLLKRILSWRVFAVLDQLTMIVFVLHPMIMITKIGAARELVFYEHDILIDNFFSTTCRVFILAFVLHVVAEQPVMSFNKWLWSRGQTSDTASVSSRKVPPKISCRGISLKNILILEPSDGPVAGHK